MLNPVYQNSNILKTHTAKMKSSTSTTGLIRAEQVSAPQETPRVGSGSEFGDSWKSNSGGGAEVLEPNSLSIKTFGFHDDSNNSMPQAFTRHTFYSLSWMGFHSQSYQLCIYTRHRTKTLKWIRSHHQEENG